MASEELSREALQAQVTKMRSQQEVLKRAVLQEQRRRGEAEQARDTLAAQVSELTELAAGHEIGGRPATTPASGWLTKGLGGWMGAAGHPGRERDGKRGLPALEAELLAKAEENEALHIRLSELSTAHERDKAALAVIRQVAWRYLSSPPALHAYWGNATLSV